MCMLLASGTKCVRNTVMPGAASVDIGLQVAKSS